jgi:hypothetical protein
MSEDELAEGRVRRGRALLGGILGIALLGALPFVFGRLQSREAIPNPQDARIEGSAPSSPFPAEPPSAGRLVYVADEPGRPDGQRLWVLDLSTGSVAAGPAFENAGGPYELRGAGPAGSWPVLIRHGPESVALVFEDLSSDGAPVEIARASLISLASDGSVLLVAKPDPGAATPCPEPTYRLSVVGVETGGEVESFSGRLPCGRLSAATLYASRIPVVTLVRGTSLHVAMLAADGAQELFRGVVAGWTGGRYLFPVRRSQVLVWPGGGALRPLVTGARLAGAVLASSADGRYVAVEGRIGEEEGIWVVDVPAGTARLLPVRREPPLAELSAATFDAEDQLFAAGPAAIVAQRGSTLVPIRLPAGAPPPVGPVAWLP